MFLRQDQAVLSPLKWAGGKRWLAKQHRRLFPTEFNRYFEAFLGGASVFLALRPAVAVLSDCNPELISVYKTLRDDWETVLAELTIHSARHSEDYYYSQRAHPPTGEARRAAWFLYMNRACYNGLYRVNRKGEFNVPKGTKSEIILGTDDFAAVSKAISNVDFRVSDFEAIVDSSEAGDFVYLDPPYTMRHNNNGFVKYNENMFSWSDQERLAKSVNRAAGRGVMVGVSNANHDSVVELYSDIGEIVVLERHSVIGGNFSARALTSEIFVRVGY